MYMAEKGVSPLIAAVILVAIVTTTAVLISGFLSDFVGEREQRARDDADRTLDCTEINLEVDTESIEMDDNLTFFLNNRNDFPIQGIRVITYDNQTVETDMSPDPENLDTLVTEKIRVNETVNDPEKITVRNKYCPNFEVTVAKNWKGEWEKEY